MEKPMVYLKIHSRQGEMVWAACDEDVLGQEFRGENKKIKVNEYFYKGKLVPLSDAVKKLSKVGNLNVVGKEIVRALAKKGVLSEYNVIKIGETYHGMKIVLRR